MDLRYCLDVEIHVRTVHISISNETDFTVCGFSEKPKNSYALW